MTEEYTNIITPPDLVEDNVYTVLIIDPDWTAIEDLVLYLKTSSEKFNVYVYKAEMNDPLWLDKVIGISSVIIVDTVQNELSQIKDHMVVNNPVVWHYGIKNFLMSKQRIEAPIDYFVSVLHPQEETNGAL